MFLGFRSWGFRVCRVLDLGWGLGFVVGIELLIHDGLWSRIQIYRVQV